tara:strand:+ start:2916 stop:4616 length:1701 start_codon:yes stop_codon:yes gene_type:complete
MTIKKLMMGAGAIDEPQVIAPSSNDFDMSFTSNNWFVAGNTLGDHTSGGFITSTSEASLSSLTTFDGDFEIQFTATDLGAGIFGVAEIAEDSSRASNNHHGMNTDIEAFAYSEVDQGSGQGSYSYNYGNSSQTNSQIADTSVLKITRVSGVISIFDDDSLKHEFTQTNSNPMRFFMGSTAAAVNIDNILYTDTEKVQRDGMFDEGGSNSSYGDYYSNRKHSATLFTATRTGTVTGLKVQVAAVSTAFSTHAELWTHDGTNPAAQVGSDSDSITLSSTGVKNFTFTDPTVTKGRKYWMVMVDESTNGWVAMLDYTAHPQGMGAGRHDTITSIADDWAEGMKMEITVDTSDGEPTPDHDTLLLIHSDTSDASTTFVDSSPSGRTITVVNNTQHDTAQKKFGASSILFDGTNDELTIPDSADWVFAGNFTIDFWIRTGTAGDLMTHATSATAGNTNFDFRLGGGGSQFGALVSNGSSFPINIVGGANLADSAWHHLALVRLGNRFDIYVAGTSVANATSAVSINDVSAPITIGKAFNGANDFNGHMDEIRISKVARWDANFTPPSAPYP